ncbi:MAG: HAD family hydrolase [Desulfuromonas sp.]|nr:MAG: HAD family hydrolase [Desulfuromonas sp.]
MNIPYEAIFWDNDGVLMQSEHLYYQANAEILAEVDVELNLTTFRQISLQQGESVLGLAAGKESMLRPMRDQRYEKLLANALPMPGAEALLCTLQGQVPMAIVTSCRRAHFERMHQNSGLLQYVDFVLTREDYRRSKPDPEPYRLACRRTGVLPRQALAVEDSERGVAAAVAAGLNVIAFPGEMNQGGDFRQAKVCIESLAELHALFGQPVE